MNYSFLLYGVLILLLICITIFIVIGLNYRPKFADTPVSVKLAKEEIRSFCQEEKTTCDTDSDCNNKCLDNIQLQCVNIERNDAQAKLYGEGGKFCLPAKPTDECIKENGGIWAWSGWSSTDRMEWNCLCSYPQLAGGNGCKLNPNVCTKGTWKYNALKDNRAPSASDCECKSGDVLMETINIEGGIGGIPLCIPKDSELCGTDEMCLSTYRNTVIPYTWEKNDICECTRTNTTRTGTKTKEECEPLPCTTKRYHCNYTTMKCEEGMDVSDRVTGEIKNTFSIKEQCESQCKN